MNYIHELLPLYLVHSAISRLLFLHQFSFMWKFQSKILPPWKIIPSFTVCKAYKAAEDNNLVYTHVLLSLRRLVKKVNHLLFLSGQWGWLRWDGRGCQHWAVRSRPGGSSQWCRSQWRLNGRGGWRALSDSGGRAADWSFDFWWRNERGGERGRESFARLSQSNQFHGLKLN